MENLHVIEIHKVNVLGINIFLSVYKYFSDENV